VIIPLSITPIYAFHPTTSTEVASSEISNDTRRITCDAKLDIVESSLKGFFINVNVEGTSSSEDSPAPSKQLVTRMEEQEVKRNFLPQRHDFSC